MILEQVESVRRRPQGPEAARLLQNPLDDSLKKERKMMNARKIVLTGLLMLCSCQPGRSIQSQRIDRVKLITLDPGHFHAALVQKSMYKQIDPVVHVYAPQGPDVQDHLDRIAAFNARPENPTSWVEQVYTGPDFLEKMLSEKKGNVVVISGKNSLKTDYIYKSVNDGLHVLADKPMLIVPEKFPLLVKAFEMAKKKGVFLYDIMTERYEITTILQKELAAIEEVFGRLETGTPDNPAVTKESVHHFYKTVAGQVNKRPGWFFDPAQRGEDLADVSTHLVDLIQWECFPEQAIDYRKEIRMLSARRWTTPMTAEQFTEVTGLAAWPDYLLPYVKDGLLQVVANGEMNYTLRGVCAKVSVTWKYQAPAGAGDMHYSILRGSRSNLIIQQGPREKYRPTLYVQTLGGEETDRALHKAISATLQGTYPGIGLEPQGPGYWKIRIPDAYVVGHEEHFAQVTEQFLKFLKEGKMLDWEVANMIAKYYTISQALKMAVWK
jgi:predicted dehydrogenase